MDHKANVLTCDERDILSHHNSTLMYVHMCLFGFAWNITSISIDGFQNNLAQMFSFMSRCAI